MMTGGDDDDHDDVYRTFPLTTLKWMCEAEARIGTGLNIHFCMERVLISQRDSMISEELKLQFAEIRASSIAQRKGISAAS